MVQILPRNSVAIHILRFYCDIVCLYKKLSSFPFQNGVARKNEGSNVNAIEKKKKKLGDIKKLEYAMKKKIF